MFNSGKNVIKKQRKNDGYLSNSTDSLRIYHLGDTENLAYSYNEVIAVKDDKRKIIFFNYYSFSPTTSSHQSTIRSWLGNHSIYGKYEFIYLRVPSMNYLENYLNNVKDLEGWIIDEIKKGDLRDIDYFLPCAKEIPLSKAAIKRIEKAVNLEKKELIIKREMRRLSIKLSNLEYSKKTFLSKIKRFEKLSGCKLVVLPLGYNGNIETLKEYLPFLEENKIQIQPRSMEHKQLLDERNNLKSLTKLGD